MDAILPIANGFAVNGADLALASILAVGLVVGLAQGLIRQALVLLASYLALILAAQYHSYLGRNLDVWFAEDPGVRNIIALVALFVAFAVILNWLARFIYYHNTSLPALVWGDRLTGAALGLVWAWALAGLALTIVNLATSVSWQGWESDRMALASTLSQSNLAPVISSFVPYLYESLRPWLPQGLPAIFTF